MRMVALKFRPVILAMMVFLILFASSVYIVHQVRYRALHEKQTHPIVASNYAKNKKSLKWKMNTPKVLFLDRWVGIEGVMAVSSYPQLGWDFLFRAWQEKISDNVTSF